MKKILIAVVSVFVAWFVLDFIIHGLILASAYEATQEMWRPQEEMMRGLISFTVLVSAIVFVLIYACFFKDKNLANGVKYGILFGIGAGISMAYGTYAYLPIPYYMALTWFLGRLVEAVVAGAIVGAIVKGNCTVAEATSDAD